MWACDSGGKSPNVGTAVGSPLMWVCDNGGKSANVGM